MQDRLKTFAGIQNFRDYGGYPTRDGRHVKRGWLYRSAHFGEASEEDVANLAAMNVGFVVDLRRMSERTTYPARWPADTDPMLVFHDSGHDREDGYEKTIRDPNLTVDQAQRYMLDFYTRAPFEDRHIALFSGYLKRLAAGDGPGVVHCMAGKDRTGIICALTLKLLGVDDEHVVDDYLLTNLTRTQEDFANRARQIAEFVGFELNQPALLRMWQVAPEYLNAAFAAMSRACNSPERYAEKVLDLSSAERDALQRHLLE